MKILGAGLSGLICGALNAQSTIWERNRSDVVEHKAVLRFRDDKVARALGLAFRKVRVNKAIWYQGEEVAPAPRFANLYSLKVRGIVADASIWNLSPSERFIAPENLHAILADICGARTHWNTTVTTSILNEMLESGPVVSTIPIVNLLSTLDIAAPLDFNYAPIYVDRYHIEDCDVFQTIYFPDPVLSTYRATLTGKLLTIESVSGTPQPELEIVLWALGLGEACPLEPLEANHRQSFGKIKPVDNNKRKALLHSLTTAYGVYSLGRYATWRNILLDDVYEDIAAIRRMMNQSEYDLNLTRAK